MPKKVKSFNNLPILVLGFNRPELFNDCIERLRSYELKNIWVSIDGPRNQNDYLKIQEIKDLCRIHKIKKNQILFSKKNNGCRNGVNIGISWFFKQNIKGLVVEDDIEIDKKYIKKINFLLEEFKNNDEIFSISSHYEFKDINHNYEKNDEIAFFKSPLCRVWGWASWQDRWEKHLLVNKFKLTRNPIACFFALPKAYRTANTALNLALCISGDIDTWDYEWNFSHVFLDSYSLTPFGIFSLNHGFSESATHTKFGNMPWEKMDNIISTKNNDSSKIIEITSKQISKISSSTGFNITNNWKIEFIKVIVKIVNQKIKNLLNFKKL